MRSVLGKLGLLFDRRAKIQILLATIGSVLVALLETSAIVMVLPLVDLASGAPADSGILGRVSELLGNPSRDRLGIILVGFVVVAFVVKDLATLGFTWWQVGVIQHQRVQTSVRMMRHFMSQPYSTHTQRTTAELLRTMNDSVGQVYSSAVNGGIGLITSSVTVLAILLALLLVTPVTTLILIAYFSVAAVAYLRLMRPKSVRAGEEILAASVQAYQSAFYALDGFKEIKVRNSSEYFVGMYQGAGRRGARAAQIANFVAVAPKYLLEIMFILAVALLLVTSFTQDGGASAVGTLALFVAAGFRLLPNVTGVMGAISSFRMGTKALDIIYDELKASRVTFGAPPVEERSRMPFERALTLQDVSFRYPGADVDVLSGIDLTIPHGSSVAFVGGSGAGKTTLADLILGIYEPTAGRLAADGRDIHDDVVGWMANVAMVPQEVYLTNGSLAENIAFDVPRGDIDEEALQQVVSQAQLDDLIVSLPYGLDTRVGERGVLLSGGQRQRIGIARALYRRPKVLVMDEATSALDNETERRITETVDRLHGEITLVQVAHRLSTVKRSDQIVYLDGGKVDAIGTFAELQVRSAGFRRLVELGSLTPN